MPKSKKNKEHSYVVYMHTAPNGKSYVGQTLDYKRRCEDHNQAGSRCRAFKSAITKYGWANFTHAILAEGLTLEEANEAEDHLIKQHNTLAPNGYNLKTGGKNFKFTDEVRARMSASAKLKSPEVIARQAAALRGRKISAEIVAKVVAATTGKKRTDEFRQRLSALNTGKKHSEESRRKMSEAAKRRAPISEETRAKISAASRAQAPMSEETRAKRSASATGKKHSAETRQKISAAKRNITDETRARIAASHKGRLQSAEHIAKRLATFKATMAAKANKKEAAQGDLFA